MSAEPVYKLDSVSFSGPLELLLGLIEKNKVDIYDIPIAVITEQYLDYVASMESVDLDVMSDFIVMAATLLDIKARLLIPQEEEGEAEETDPREELASRLALYRRCRLIAEALAERETYAGRYIYRSALLPEEYARRAPSADIGLLMKDVTPGLLTDIFERLEKRARDAVNEEAARFTSVPRDRISIVRCIRRLVSIASGKKNFSFREMLDQAAGRPETVASFLAVLELMRMGAVSVTQKREFGDIRIRVKESADLNSLDLSGIVDE